MAPEKVIKSESQTETAGPANIELSKQFERTQKWPQAHPAGPHQNGVVHAAMAVRDDLGELAKALKYERNEMRRRIRERPWVALGAAFGIGFVLSGGLASLIAGWILLGGMRVSAAQLARGFAAEGRA